MNRSEVVAKWDALSPRERDAWVAEVVFGATVIGGNVEKIPDGFRPVPRYTAKISAAWAVMESFVDVRVQRYETIMGAFRYGCTISYVVDKVYETVGESADTAPEAICLAALVAKHSDPDAEQRLLRLLSDIE